MSLAEVKSIREGQRPLTDIPAMLRGLADMIESGGYPYLDEIVVVHNVPDAYPAIHSYGHTSTDSTIRLLLGAQAALIEMLHNGKGKVSR